MDGGKMSLSFGCDSIRGNQHHWTEPVRVTGPLLPRSPTQSGVCPLAARRTDARRGHCPLKRQDLDGLLRQLDLWS
jgi:hypothetical protein